MTNKYSFKWKKLFTEFKIRYIYYKNMFHVVLCFVFCSTPIKNCNLEKTYFEICFKVFSSTSSIYI